jgi:23S rRNA-/tRNA-specific pseudouridylate synthase
MHAEVCVRQWLKKSGRDREKLILLHRLDKETSGILLFATNANTATWITDQFRQRSLSKTYWALCRGLPKLRRFEVECYLSEIDKKTGLVREVNSGGKPSRTTFEERVSNAAIGASWIVCHPETGRSHQIRVHLEMKGLPIIGDKRYGRQLKHSIREDVATLGAVHHMLHARELEFSPAPGIDAIKITAEPPQDFHAITELIADRDKAKTSP